MTALPRKGASGAPRTKEPPKILIPFDLMEISVLLSRPSNERLPTIVRFATLIST